MDYNGDKIYDSLGLSQGLDQENDFNGDADDQSMIKKAKILNEKRRIFKKNKVSFVDNESEIYRNIISPAKYKSFEIPNLDIPMNSNLLKFKKNQGRRKYRSISMNESFSNILNKVTNNNFQNIFPPSTNRLNDSIYTKTSLKQSHSSHKFFTPYQKLQFIKEMERNEVNQRILNKKLSINFEHSNSKSQNVSRNNSFIIIHESDKGERNPCSNNKVDNTNTKINTSTSTYRTTNKSHTPEFNTTFKFAFIKNKIKFNSVFKEGEKESKIRSGEKSKTNSPTKSNILASNNNGNASNRNGKSFLTGLNSDITSQIRLVKEEPAKLNLPLIMMINKKHKKTGFFK